PPRMTARLALGQRARLGDVVVRVLVREGQIGPAEVRADLGEGPRRTAAREVAVAVVARVGERERPVEGARRASETKAQVLAAEAPGRDLGDDLARLPSPPRDHVDRAAERVAPEDDGRAGD